MTSADDELRERLLLAAEAQLIDSTDNDIATRAVCEAAGVSQPVLYRLFGDKQGLLTALVDHGYACYIARKSAQAVTGDAVADLRAGWDDHMEFARTNPAVYRLMFSPNPAGKPTARRQIFDLLVATLKRAAAEGRMTVPPQVAAPAILSANVGIALNRITQPDLYDDPDLSARVREAIFASFLTVQPEPEAHEAVGDGGDGSALRTAAVRLAAQLDLSPSVPLIDEERALLRHWLDRLSAAPPR